MSGTEIELPVVADATHTPDEGGAEHRPTPRDTIMANIAARREEQIARENAQAAIYDREATEAGLNFAEDTPDDADPAPAESKPAKVQAEPKPAAPKEEPRAAPQVREILLNDGQRYSVTEQQADELMRLGLMANTALHQHQMQQPRETPPPPDFEIDNDMVRETVRKMQYSGEDDATAAMSSLIQNVVQRMPRAPAFDPNEIVSRAVAETRAQAQLAADSALIRQEYEDIFAHPQREFLARVNVDAIRQRNIATGARQAELDIYREAGDQVREAMGLPTPSRPGNERQQPTALQATQGVIRSDVIERKRAAPRATQGIDLRAPSAPLSRAPSGSDIVDQMRARRGQASMR